MEQLAAIEQSAAKVFKDLPHFPKSVRNWVGENAWWIVLIGVVLGVFGVLSSLAALTVFGSAFVGVAVVAGGSAAAGVVILSAVVTLVGYIVTVVLEALAIQPLKAKKKRGWDLIFMAWIVNLILALVSAVVNVGVGSNIFGVVSGLVWTAIVAAVGLYILFEFRSFYLSPQSTAPEAKAADDLTPPKPPVAS